METYGREISEEQEQAGLAAMTGEFRASDVVSALQKAGLPNNQRGLAPVAMRTADKLLQRERKKGRIQTVPGHRALWRTTSDSD